MRISVLKYGGSRSNSSRDIQAAQFVIDDERRRVSDICLGVGLETNGWDELLG